MWVFEEKPPREQLDQPVTSRTKDCLENGVPFFANHMMSMLLSTLQFDLLTYPTLALIKANSKRTELTQPIPGQLNPIR